MFARASAEERLFLMFRGSSDVERKTKKEARANQDSVFI